MLIWCVSCNIFFSALPLTYVCVCAWVWGSVWVCGCVYGTFNILISFCSSSLSRLSRTFAQPHLVQKAWLKTCQVFRVSFGILLAKHPYQISSIT